MKWRSHISIGKAIADILGLPPGERRAFLDGMVEPDRHKERVSGPGFSYRVMHHRPNRRVVMLHIWMARRSLLRNDNYQGYRHLGMALHYIQDKSTSKGLLGATHGRRERTIAELDVPMKAIEEGFRDHTSSPEFVSRCLELTKPMKNPRRALAQAAYSSAAVAAAVTDLRRPAGLEEGLRSALHRHYFMNLPLAVGSVAIGSSLSLAWSSLLPLVPSLLLILTAFAMDRPYRRMDRLARWHGLKRN